MDPAQLLEVRARLRDVTNLPAGAVRPNGSIAIERSQLRRVLGEDHVFINDAGLEQLRGDSQWATMPLLPEEMLEWILNPIGPHEFVMPFYLADIFFVRRQA